MKKNGILICFLMMVLSGMSLFMVAGCGKKGPPVPPRIEGQVIAAPFDLKYRMNNANITLFWKHRIDAKKAFVTPRAFEIFMAKKASKACVGCPFKFIKTGVVSMPSMRFTMAIQKGYKYYFRVQALGDGQMRSDCSKTVQFEY